VKMREVKILKVNDKHKEALDSGHSSFARKFGLTSVLSLTQCPHPLLVSTVH
jgi:hypothetical protein